MYDVIVIGQGLAGSMFALSCWRQGIRCAVVDDGWKTSSSTVAAGIYHPMVFRKLTMSFLADICIPFAEEVYQGYESSWGQALLHPREIWKVLASVEEQNNWEAKRGLPYFSEVLGDVVPVKALPASVKAPYGIGVVKKAGNLDIPTFLEHAFRSFVANDAYFRAESPQLAQTDTGWQVRLDTQTLSAPKVVMARGNRAFFDGSFSYLPIGATKGDILEVSFKGLPYTKEILNKGFWLLPMGNDHYKLGSTYEWNNHTTTPSEAAKAELLEKLQSVVDVPIKVKRHYSGLRPTCADRRPLLGEHPEQKGLYFFNGLGSKGVMMAPWCAEHLVSHIFEDASLLPEVDVKRFEKRYK